MNRKEAIELLTKTLSSPFSENNFIELVANLLNDLQPLNSRSIQGKYIKKPYIDYIKQYKRIGKLVDFADRRIDVLIVKLKKDYSLERARTMQRNFIAQY